MASPEAARQALAQMGATLARARHFEDNERKWAGDHIIDPALVPGVVFMNQPFRHDARLVDMAPTILAALGVAPSAAMEGTSLL